MALGLSAPGPGTDGVEDNSLCFELMSVGSVSHSSCIFWLALIFFLCALSRFIEYHATASKKEEDQMSRDDFLRYKTEIAFLRKQHSSEIASLAHESDALALKVRAQEDEISTLRARESLLRNSKLKVNASRILNPHMVSTPSSRRPKEHLFPSNLAFVIMLCNDAVIYCI